MRFFTKEWYQTMQNSSLDVCLKVDSRAEVFSEEFYKELYEEGFIDFFETRRKFGFVKEPFDISEEIKLFRRNLRYYKNLYTTVLPKEILENVADIRVLALHHCSQQAKKAISCFVDNCKKQIEKTFSDYAEYEKELFENARPEWLNDFDFHDAFVASFRKVCEDYVLCIDDEKQEFVTQKIIFKDAEIVEQEKRLNGSLWLYEEIHKTENGYEICVLFHKKGIFEFTIRCSDIILE